VPVEVTVEHLLELLGARGQDARAGCGGAEALWGSAPLRPAADDMQRNTAYISECNKLRVAKHRWPLEVTSKAQVGKEIQAQNLALPRKSDIQNMQASEYLSYTFTVPGVLGPR
jgi:hypothetical protein